MSKSSYKGKEGSTVNKLVCAVVLACVGLLAAGCAPNTEPIERAANAAIDKVIAPVVQKAGEELTSRTAQFQGQGSLINPGYKISGFGILGTGVVYDLTIKADGFSANVAGATQQDAGQPATVQPPVNRPATQPAAIQKEEVPAKPVKFKLKR